MNTPAASDGFSSVVKQPLSDAQLSAAQREYRMLKWLVVAALWLACALSLSLNIADPDLWGHVHYGQELLSEGELPRTATHTYTAEGYRWVNHETVAEVAYATIYTWFDDEGLLAFKLLAGLATLACMAWVAHRHGVGPLATAAFLLLVANNLTPFFPVRPQVFSFAYCGLMLLLLELAFTGWSLWLHDSQGRAEAAPDGACRWTAGRLAWLLSLAPLMVLWANSHGGFVAGLCILLAYLGGRALEAIYHRRRQSIAVVFAITAIGVLAVAATLVNPYGAGLHGWLWQSLQSPRPEITEWTHLRPTNVVFWPFLLLAGTALLSLVFTKRKRDWVQIAILLLTAWQACVHMRHVAFFAILTGFWIAPHLKSALGRLKPDTRKLSVQQLGAWGRWSLAGALLIAIALQSGALTSRLSALPVHRSMYPVDAFQWMTFKGIDGKLVCSYNWSQYAICALAPDTQVAFDGRFRTCYPQQVVDHSFDFLLGENHGRRYRDVGTGPIDPTAILDINDPDLVLVDRKYAHSVQVMQDESQEADPEWALLYQDGVAQLWGRRTVYDDPHSSRYVAPEERLITDRVHSTAFAWPALPLQPVSKSLAERHVPITQADNL